MLPPAVIPICEVLQFHAKHGGLDRIHAGIPAELGMDVALRAAVIPQATHMLSHRPVVRRYHPRIAIRAQVLGWIKAERSRSTYVPSVLTAPFGADGLRRILDQHDIMLGRDFAQGVHVCALAIEV